LLNDDVKAAMLLLIGHWYANRESVAIGQTVAEVPLAVEALLQPYRIYGV
ncbi:TPA: head-tail connector protein, partial [Enterobacter hormaechei]